MDPVKRQSDIVFGGAVRFQLSSGCQYRFGVSELRTGVTQESRSHTNHASGPAVGLETPQPLNFQPQTSQFPDSVGEESAPCLE